MHQQKQNLYNSIMNGPSDITRTLACKEPKWAYEYALNVDKGPRDDTRAACNKVPHFTALYALNVDKCLHIDTAVAVVDVHVAFQLRDLAILYSPAFCFSGNFWLEPRCIV